MDDREARDPSFVAIDRGDAAFERGQQERAGHDVGAPRNMNRDGGRGSPEDVVHDRERFQQVEGWDCADLDEGAREVLVGSQLSKVYGLGLVRE